MKSLILSLIFVLFLSVPLAFGWSLVCDPQVDVIFYDVEVDGVIVVSGYSAEANGSIDYNIDSLGPGPVIFRLRAISVNGWGSDWSVPFDVTKPGSPGNARIVKDITD